VHLPEEARIGACSERSSFEASLLMSQNGKKRKERDRLSGPKIKGAASMRLYLGRRQDACVHLLHAIPNGDLELAQDARLPKLELYPGSENAREDQNAKGESQASPTQEGLMI